MTCACITNEKKIRISLQTALIAFVIFNPVLFQAVQGILGRWVASSDGCPTMMGLLLHVVLFGIIIYLLMKPYKKTLEKIKNHRQTLPGLPLV